MKLTVGTKSPPYKPKPKDALTPEQHATLQGLILELDALALRLDKGLAIITELEEAGDPREEAARAKWETLNKEYQKLYGQYDMILGSNPWGCPQCKLQSGEEVDWMHIPPTARLCLDHARNFMATRAEVRWPLKAEDHLPH